MVAQTPNASGAVLRLVAGCDALGISVYPDLQSIPTELTFMTTQHDKAKRRFTVSELLVYVSLLCLSLGILRTAYTVREAYPPSAIVILLGFIVLGAYCVLGPLIGIPGLHIHLSTRSVAFVSPRCLHALAFRAQRRFPCSRARRRRTSFRRGTS